MLCIIVYMNIRRIFLFSTVSLFTIIGALTTKSKSFNDADLYNARTQVETKFSTTSNNEAIELGTLDDRVLVNVMQINTTETSASVQLRFELSEEAKLDSNLAFYIGYGENLNDPNEQKASLVYNVQTYEGDVETRITPINRLNANSAYDGLGAIGNTDFTTFCDVPLNPGEELLDEDFSIINIFLGVKNEDGRYSVYKDESGNLEHLYTICEFQTTYRNRNLEDFIAFNYVGASTFNGYTSINVNVTNNLEEDYYSKLTASINRVYNQQERDIRNGIAYIRTRINLSNVTKYYVYYEDQAEPLIFDSIETYFNVTNNGTLEILLEGVDIDKIVDFEIKAFYVYCDIFSSETNGSVRSSSIGLRFSSSDVGMQDLIASNGEVLKDKTLNPYKVDLDLAMGLSVAGFVILYEAISIFTFFYLKNKNKDDEFKRMIPKQYFKTNTMGLLTLGILLVTIEAIAFRVSLMKNTLPIFNSLDIIIVIGGVASIILVGYFIRYFAIQFKNMRDAKRNEKLKLNKNTMDDGTLIITSPSKGE